MTDQNEFMSRIITLLDRAGIAYMVSGSIGSSFHGHPRATNDTDIVIDPTQEQLSTFVHSLGQNFYVSRDAAMQAFEHRTMFNVIDINTADKADLIIRKNRPFSIQEFARRAKAEFAGMQLYVLSPEDSILSKLEWSKDRQSSAQFQDALSVLMVQRDRIDYDYLRHWARELGVDNALDQLLEKIK